MVSSEDSLWLLSQQYIHDLKDGSENNMKGLKNFVSEAISMVSLVVIPATIGAMLFSRDSGTTIRPWSAFRKL